MKDFKGKVAVITGGASGIGRGIAERCIQEEMIVVLADIEKAALENTRQELSAGGASILAVRTDVSRIEDLQELARLTLNAFGAVHLLFNNAGVAAGTTAWASTEADWQWVVGVNLMGVIHGLQVFMPIMLEQDTECHIVNTASVAGLLTRHISAPYVVTKHAVVALSEHTFYSLIEQKAKVAVSVLCPGWVKTRIMDSERNRPPKYQNVSDHQIYDTKTIMEYQQAVQEGMSPQEVADHVFEGIRENRFYILTHPEYNPMIQERMEAILQGCNPKI